MSRKKVAIVGGGIGGLGTAALLAKNGYDVDVYEKNATLGGRCNYFKAQGFFFDTGPSWYLMPPIFEHIFSLLDERIEDHLELVKLTPSYRAFYDTLEQPVDFSTDSAANDKVFEQLEKGASGKIRKYLSLARARYEFCDKYVFHEAKDGFLHYLRLIFRKDAPPLGLFTPMSREVARVTTNKELGAPFYLPAAFLGGIPQRTPAFFTFLGYSLFTQGVLYPQGGMYKLVEALVSIGKKHGVRYHTDTSVISIDMHEGGGTLILGNGERIEADIIVCNADREYTRTRLLRRLTFLQKFIRQRKPGFSTVLIFLGVGRKIPELQHHNVFFTEHWATATQQIERGILPEDPLLYVSAPSVTDPSCAPAGMENLFVLIPVPASLSLTQEELDKCAARALLKLSARTSFREQDIVFQKRWYPKDLASAYNTPHGAALGLAHTIFQNGLFRPRHVDERSKHLYYVGATTNPGIGVPTCLLSAEQVLQTILENEG